ncbi:MAG: hypothetical protein D4Q79_00730 [Spirochaetia bacterium]|nr:MAG: hypothetical protein D4Q79_00730 [Spirochaetia bacterium]
MDVFLKIFSGIINGAIAVFNYSWWIILPVFLFLIAWDLWMVYIRTKYVKSIERAIFEIKIPKEILKTPKAMEAVFNTMIGIYSFGLSSVETYLAGKVERWVSFEIVGHAGGVRFYVQTPSEFKNLVESAIYAQYPAAEINKVEDYVNSLPPVLTDKTYDLWGTELILVKENYLPIKTYQFFEEIQDEKRLDPLAAIIETMSNLKNDEWIGIQVLISPTGELNGNMWQKEGYDKIEEMAGRKTAKNGKDSEFMAWVRNVAMAPAEYPVWPGEKKPEAPTLRFLHPAEQDMVKGIANKISKIGFETIVRFIYVDSAKSFTSANVSATMGAFNQFRSNDMNALKPDKRTVTLRNTWFAKLVPIYKKLFIFSRKRRLFESYRTRRFGKHKRVRPEKFSVLSTEELATIYHFPAIMIESPNLIRLGAKKGGPPTELPVE